MNLQQLIEQFLAYRQSLGECRKPNGSRLRAFGRAIGPTADIADVRPEQVRAFLAGAGPVTRNWHCKLSALRAFYRYAVGRGYVASPPLPTVIPKRPPGFVPHVYSPDELRRLLRAADAGRHPLARLEPVTMRTLLLLLYGTGLRVQEALDLNRADVDLGGALLTVRRAKFGKTRLVPFGPQLGSTLARYAARLRAADAGAPFFTTRTGVRVNADTLRQNYRALCERAGVRRTDGARLQPRLHDLRHTFAVHRLTAWYRQRADVQRLLPHLSVYLGHAHLAATQVYLTMTPELLDEAGRRFGRYAAEEDGHD